MTGKQPTDPDPDLEGLEPAFTEPSVEQRVYSLVVQSGDEWSAPDVAERLDCSTDTARKYLNWFAELGIVLRHNGRPTTYERNEEYFEWRYVTQLAESQTVAELKANVRELREQLRTYRDRYNREGPDAVDLSDAVQDLDADIEEVWDELTAWASIEDELRLHERARRIDTDEPNTRTA